MNTTKALIYNRYLHKCGIREQLPRQLTNYLIAKKKHVEVKENYVGPTKIAYVDNKLSRHYNKLYIHKKLSKQHNKLSRHHNKLSRHHNKLSRH